MYGTGKRKKKSEAGEEPELKRVVSSTMSQFASRKMKGQKKKITQFLGGGKLKVFFAQDLMQGKTEKEGKFVYRGRNRKNLGEECREREKETDWAVRRRVAPTGTLGVFRIVCKEARRPKRSQSPLEDPRGELNNTAKTTREGKANNVDRRVHRKEKMQARGRQNIWGGSPNQQRGRGGFS